MDIININNKHKYHYRRFYDDKFILVFKNIIYWLLIIDLATVVTPVKIKFPWISQAAIIAITIILPIFLNWKTIFKNNYILLVILSYGLFLIFDLIQHGPSINEYVYRFSRLLPLFFVGVIASRHSRWIVNFFFVTLVGVLWGNLPLLTESGSLVSRSMLPELGIYLISPTRYMVAVFSSLVAFYTYQYYKRNYLIKYILVILFLTNTLVVIKSGYTAAILSLLIGYSAMGATAFFKKKYYNTRKRIKIAVLFIGLALSTYYILVRFAPDSVPAYRIRNIVSYMEGNTSVDIANVSGLRTYLAQVSWKTFLSNPLIGVGSYAFIPGIRIIGGHSTVLDMFAQFGLIGGIPVIGMLLSWLFAAITIYRHNKTTYLGLALIGLWSAYLAGCIMNPYLFSGAVDHYVFTFAGITVGLAHKLDIVKKRKTLIAKKLG